MGSPFLHGVCTNATVGGEKVASPLTFLVKCAGLIQSHVVALKNKTLDVKFFLLSTRSTFRRYNVITRCCPPRNSNKR